MDNRLHLEDNKTFREPKVKVYSLYEMPYKWKSFRGFWGNIFYWLTKRRKYMKQRSRYGYCDVDVWNCGDHLVEQMAATLTEFRNTTNCWPDRYFDTYEQWIAYIDEIINLLEYALTDNEELNEYYPKWKETWEWDKERRDSMEYITLFDKYCAEVNRIYKSQIQAREEAFNLLAPYIHLIWW